MKLASRGGLVALLLTATLPAFAESEAMQRERSLNRILVAERLERERAAAARGSGLMGIKPAARAAEAQVPKKPAKRRHPNERPQQP